MTTGMTIVDVVVGGAGVNVIVCGTAVNRMANIAVSVSVSAAVMNEVVMV